MCPKKGFTIPPSRLRRATSLYTREAFGLCKNQKAPLCKGGCPQSGLGDCLNHKKNSTGNSVEFSF